MQMTSQERVKVRFEIEPEREITPQALAALIDTMTRAIGESLKPGAQASLTLRIAMKRRRLPVKIIIESTDKIVELNGVPARIWEGQTESGVPVLVWVNLISPQTHDRQINAQFERELREVKPASPGALQAYDMRYFID